MTKFADQRSDSVVGWASPCRI